MAGSGFDRREGDGDQGFRLVAGEPISRSKNGSYVQQSGPKNSLGVVKLDMQDPQQIYLHDTPAKALFALPERHRSHGCVRVQNALQFASMLAEQDGVLDKFQKAMATGDETYVKLKTNIPVRLSITPHSRWWPNPVPA